LLLRSPATSGIEPGSAQHITYSLYQLLFSNIIRNKTTILESSQMVSCQDIFSLLQEPQNGTRYIFNPAKSSSSVIRRLNYSLVSVHFGFASKPRHMFVFPLALIASPCPNHIPIESTNAWKTLSLEVKRLGTRNSPIISI